MFEASFLGSKVGWVSPGDLDALGCPRPQRLAALARENPEYSPGRPPLGEYPSRGCPVEIQTKTGVWKFAGVGQRDISVSIPDITHSPSLPCL
jgi:hypothetical protein